MTIGSAAAQAAIPTVKALTGWSPAAVGIWSILLTLLSGIALAIVKAGPNWISAYSASRKQSADVEAAAQAELERREAAEQAERERRERALETRIEALERRVSSTEERAIKAETAVMHLTGASTIMMSTLRTVSPNNPAIDQARDLIEMAVASGGDSVFAKSLSRLAQVKGVNE